VLGVKYAGWLHDKGDRSLADLTCDCGFLAADRGSAGGHDLPEDFVALRRTSPKSAWNTDVLRPVILVEQRQPDPQAPVFIRVPPVTPQNRGFIVGRLCESAKSPSKTAASQKRPTTAQPKNE